MMARPLLSPPAPVWEAAGRTKAENCRMRSVSKVMSRGEGGRDGMQRDGKPPGVVSLALIGSHSNGAQSRMAVSFGLGGRSRERRSDCGRGWNRKTWKRR